MENIVERMDEMDGKKVVKEIRLRPLEMDDATEVLRLASRDKVARYMRFDTLRTLEEARLLIQEYRKGVAWAVLSEEIFRGVCALNPPESSEDGGRYSMSIFLDEAVWNRGIASELVRRDIEYARNILRCPGLLAYVEEQNRGSCRTLEKNGFQLERKIRFADMEGCLLVFGLWF